MRKLRFASFKGSINNLIAANLPRVFSLASIHVLFLMVAIPIQAWSATIQSNGTGGGPWNVGSSWNGGLAPLPGDDVLILSTDIINAATTESCVNLRIEGTLNFSTNSVTISVTGDLTFAGTGSTSSNNASRSLNVTSNLFSLTGADGAISGINLFIGGTTDLQGRLVFNNATGSKTFTGDVTINDGGAIDFTGGVSLILVNSLFMSGTSSLGGTSSSTGTLIGVNSFTVNAGAAATIGRVTMAIVGVTTINGTTTFNNTNGTKTFIGACTINNNAGFEFTAGAAVNFNSTLTLSGTTSLGNTSSATGNISVVGGVTVTPGADLTLGRITITVNGATTIGGAVLVNNTAGTKTLSGVVSILNTGSLTFSASETIDMGNDLATDPGSTLGGGGATGIINVGGNYTANSGGASNLGTLTLNITGNVTAAGTAVIDTSGGTCNINLGGNWNITSSDPNPFVEGTSRVTFNGSSGTQTISTTEAGGETFYNITINNSSLANPNITPSVNVNARSFSLTSGILDLQGHHISIIGDGSSATDTFSGTIMTSIAGSTITVADPSNNKTVNISNASIGDATNNIPFTVTTANSSFDGSVFFGIVSFTKTGAVQNTCNGGNVFHLTTTFTTSVGADRWAMGGVNPDTFNANVTFTHNGNSNWRIARSLGNVFNGTTTFTNNSSGLIYLGRINNTTNGSATFNGPVIVNVMSSGSVQFSESDALIQNTALFDNTIQLNSIGGASGNILFGSTGFGSTTLTANAQFIAGSLLGATTVTILRLTQNGNVLAQTLTGAGTSILQTGNATPGDGSVFNAAVTVTFPQIQLRNSTFNGATNLFTQTGTVANTTFGGNAFATGTSTTFTNQGTGIWRLGNSGADDFNGNVTFVRLGGAGSLEPSYTNNSTYAGNISTTGTATAITFGNNGGRVTIDGTGAQNLNGNSSFPPTFLRLTMNGSGSLTLNVPLTVSTDINFTGGIINSSSTNLLILSSGSTLSGTPSNTSHVDGPVRKVGNTAFTFPTGDNGFYRGIGISAPTMATHAFTAEYFKATHAFGGPATYQDGILTLSTCEYWVLDRNVGTSNVSVTLSWVSADCPGIYIDPAGLAQLQVARWNSSNWVSHGNVGTTGTDVSGTVTSAAVTAFNSPFTLASLALINPLPIELVDFSATAIGNGVVLNWTTVSETNNDYFTVEKSIEGAEFEELSFVKGSGSTTQVTTYQFIDENPYQGISYYRLKQTDFDGKYSYSKVARIDVDARLWVYPNPAHDHATVNYKGNFILINNLGQVVLTVLGSEKLDLSQLAPGIYILKSDKGLHQRLVIE